MAIKNLAGQRFGRLIAIEDSGERRGGNVVWRCKCDCGNECYIRGYCLTSGMTKSCGCYQKENNFRNLLNQRFGKLTVIEKTEERDSTGSIKWKCKCDCGNTYITSSRSLCAGTVKSCGCLNKIDLTNKRVGKLLVLKQTDKRKYDHNVVWECLCDCGNTCYVITSNLTREKVNSCGCLGSSAGEFKITQILKDNNILFEKEKTFNSCRFSDTDRLAKFDFYINNQYLVEFDGRQHFKDTNTKYDYETTHKHDEIKNQWCKENNIPLIRIPYTHLKNLCLEDLQLETSKFII